MQPNKNFRSPIEALLVPLREDNKKKYILKNTWYKLKYITFANKFKSNTQINYNNVTFLHDIIKKENIYVEEDFDIDEKIEHVYSMAAGYNHKRSNFAKIYQDTSSRAEWIFKKILRTSNVVFVSIMIILFSFAIETAVKSTNDQRASEYVEYFFRGNDGREIITSFPKNGIEAKTLEAKMILLMHRLQELEKIANNVKVSLDKSMSDDYKHDLDIYFNNLQMKDLKISEESATGIVCSVKSEPANSTASACVQKDVIYVSKNYDTCCSGMGNFMASNHKEQ